jgi:hypothetical protein
MTALGPLARTTHPLLSSAIAMAASIVRFMVSSSGR